MSDDPNQVLGPAFFQKAGGVLRGKAPESPDPEGETPQMIPKDQEGQPKRPGGTFGRRGTLSRGSPQDAVLHHPPTKQEPRREKKRQTLRLAGAFFRFGWIRSASCRNFFEIAAAGTSAGGLSLVWGCARGATGLDFAFCGKRGRALPLPSPPAF